MAALPYMQFHVAEYLADTSHLSTEEHGAYLLLIFNYWQRGKALDNSNGRLSNVVRMSHARWSAVAPRLHEFFAVEGDIWTHSRIERDLDAVNAKCEQARTARAQRKSYGRSTGVATDVGTDVQREANDKKRVLREEKREEDLTTVPPFVPTITDQANFVTRRVLQEAPLSGQRVQFALEQVARHELSSGLDPDAVGDVLLAAWRDFCAAKPRLEYAWGAEKFFGEANWKDKAAWPWKEGQKPAAPKRQRSALDEIAEQEARANAKPIS